MEQLLAAVEIAYNDPNNVLRHDADQFIAQSKEAQGKGISQWGFAFVSGQGGQQVHVKHFGYHLLEDAVERHWDAYSAEEVAEWKQQLLAMAWQETSGLLQEKLAHVIAVVALRIWPQHWQDLFANLGALWNDQPVRRGLALRAFLAIHEETSLHSYRMKRTHELGLSGPSGRFDGRYIEAERKMAVLRAIEENALGVLAMVEHFFAVDMTRIVEGSDAALLGDVGLALRLLKLYGASAAIGDVLERRYITWVRLIGHPELRGTIAELLHDLVEAAGPAKDKDAAANAAQHDTVASFFTSLLEFLASFVQPDPRGAAALETEEGQAAHAFALHVAEVCTAVTKNDWLYSLLAGTPAGKECLRGVAVALVSHPAGTIHLHALQFIKKLLLHEATSAAVKAMGEEFITPLLHCVNGPHLVRVACEPTCKNIAGAYAAVDFEDHQEDDFMQHHTHLISVHREVAALINAASPHATLKYFITILSELLANPLPPPTAPRNPQTGGITRDCETYTAWAVMETCLMHFSDSLPKHMALCAPTPNALLSALLQATERLLQLDVGEALLIPKHAGALQCVTHVIGKEAGGHFPLRQVVQKFVGMMAFLAPGESVTGVMSTDTISARRRVQMSLMHVCEDFGTAMADHLQELLAAWVDYQSKEALTDQEVSLLTESVTSISNKLSPDHRRNVICGMMEPMMRMWNEVGGVIANRNDFTAFLAGLLQQRGTNPEHDRVRSVMRKTLCVFSGVYRRSVSVGAAAAGGDTLAQLSQTLLGSILDLLAVMNWAWTPGALAGDAVKLLTVTPEEKEQATGGAVVRHADLFSKGGVLSFNDRLLVARQYVCQLRASAYTLLGALPSFFTANYAAYQDMVMARLFTPELYHAELLQLKYLWNEFVVPFIVHTPREYLHTLPKVAPRIFRFFFDVLNRGWAEYTAKYVDDQPGGGSSPSARKFSSKQGVKVTTDDGWEMKVLTDLTSEVCSILFHVANIAQGAIVTNTKLKRVVKEPQDCVTIAAACQALCSDDNLIVSMMLLLTGAVAWPGPQAAVHAVEALQKLMTRVAQRASLHSQLCHLLGCCLHRVAVLQATKTGTPAGLKASAPLIGGRNSQLNSYLINLICDLYTTLHPIRPEPGQLLAQMGVAPEAIKQLELGLQKDNQPSKKRARFKSLLNPPRGNADKMVIQNLPQYDILAKQQRSPMEAAQKAVDEYDCTQAFSTLFAS
eukprot:TRINITY_DN20826_c0_g1_i1.p1 TRINITY_DN20826_c0_g1~~TRINITY_DN20826_c0_g1_i1.p1  ORF type:complete len:1213 (+),score=485.39 TRINITY_DN20826_c0_g1_i1:78-3716(+)